MIDAIVTAIHTASRGIQMTSRVDHARAAPVDGAALLLATPNALLLLPGNRTSALLDMAKRPGPARFRPDPSDTFRKPGRAI